MNHDNDNAIIAIETTATVTTDGGLWVFSSKIFAGLAKSKQL